MSTKTMSKRYISATKTMLNTISAFGELVCFRHAGDDITSLPIWMDQDGHVDPFSNKYFPTGFVEHIAGRRILCLPVSGFKCRAEDQLEDVWSSCKDIEQNSNGVIIQSVVSSKLRTDGNRNLFSGL